MNDKPYKVIDLSGVEVEKPICKTLSQEIYKVKFLDQIIKFGIIFINTGIRMVVIKIITFVGCSTESV